MNKEITFRQIGSLYLFIALSPILREIPRIIGFSKSNFFIDIFYSIIIILFLTLIVMHLIRTFPGLNFYEIITQVYGVMLAKIIVLLYGLWFFLKVSTRAYSYALTMELTIMPATGNNFFLIIIIILVAYALLKGVKTVFRISELCLGLVLFFIIILAIFALPNIQKEYIMTKEVFSMNYSLKSISQICIAGGNIILLLFFGDRYKTSIALKNFNKMFYYVGIFIVFTIITSVLSIGICGKYIISKSFFPFYLSVKSISILKLFERMEAGITLIAIFSDFIYISIFFWLGIHSLKWVFKRKIPLVISLFIAFVLCFITNLIGKTQFIFMSFHQGVFTTITLVFQYIIPLILLIGVYFKQNKSINSSRKV